MKVKAELFEESHVLVSVSVEDPDSVIVSVAPLIGNE